MRSFRPVTQLVTAIALVGALGGLAACESDKDPVDAGSGTPTNGTTEPAGTDETDTASGGLIDACTKVTDDEISMIVHAPVTREEIPGGGCNFFQEDPRATSLSLNSSAFDESTGGFDASISGMSALYEGDAGGPVDGVGDEAYATTGKTMGGSNTQGGGLVHVGGTLVQVGVAQGEGFSAEKVKTMVVDTLDLVAARL